MKDTGIDRVCVRPSGDGPECSGLLARFRSLRWKLPCSGSWKVQYKAGSGWKDVEAKGEYGCRKDCYNSVDFTPVKTTGLKLVVQLQEGESGGVIEWKVN